MKNVSTIAHAIPFRGKLIRIATSFILLYLIALLFVAKATAMDVALQWDTNADADYYVVYYGTSSGNYTQTSANVAAPTTQYTVTGLAETTWYFSVKAFNIFGNSSDYSAEAVYAPGSTAPVYSPLSISIASPVLYADITQGESIDFQSLVSGGMAPLTYAWNFGSGGPAGSSVEDPGNVTFADSGMYTVTLTVTDANGSVETATVIVTVTQVYIDLYPTALISSPGENVTITEGDSVQFEGSVADGNASFTYSWNFGASDVTNTTVEDPGSVVFPSAGTYTVTFTVKDNDNDVDSTTIIVTVTDRIIDVEPVATISSPSANVTITQGASVNFSGTVSSGNAPLTHEWSFGGSNLPSVNEEDPGSIVFNNTGSYAITYTVTDSDGDVSSATINVTVVAPDLFPAAGIASPSENVTINQGEYVDFDGTVENGNAPFTYTWNFGNSNLPAKTVEDPGSLQFSSAGTYTVTFTATDSDGDISSASRTVTVLVPDVNPTAAISSPSANVTINQGGSVNFLATVTSGNAPFTHAWNFGNAGIASKTVEDPGTLTFTSAGIFTVTYTVTDSDGDTNSASRIVTVKVPDVNPAAAISSPSANVTINQGGSVNFLATVTSGNAPFTHAWNFGTSGIASKTVEDPGTLTFPNAGTFNVTYTVTDSDGDTNSASRTVTVNVPDAIPTAAISSPSANVTIAQGGSLNFLATVTSGNAPFTHAWNFGNSGISSQTVEDPGTIKFSIIGTHAVSYKVTDSDGDTATATRTVTVVAQTADVNPVATITSPSANVSISQGGSVNFQGSVESGNAPFKYRWIFGTGGPAKKYVEDPGNITFPTAGTYTVSFIATDSDRDSCKDTVVVTVSAKSAVVAKQTVLSTPQDEAQVSLAPKLSAGVNAVDGETQWQVSTDASFEDVVLDVTSASGSTTLDVPSLVLDGNTTYFWRMKVNSSESLISNWSEPLSFTTGAATWNDVNGNGVPDTQETEEDIDLNNDGTADHSQDTIKTVRSFDGTTSIGLVRMERVLDIEILESMDHGTIEDTVGKPDGMPMGLIGFRILTENPGDTVLIGIALKEAAPVNAGWYKYDSIMGWQNYSSLATFSEDRKTITVELTDGGLGDADGCMNGVIVDPAGLGIMDDGAADVVDEPASIVTAEEGGGGGSGCFISGATGSFDKKTGAALLVLLAGVLALIPRRKTSAK